MALPFASAAFHPTLSRHGIAQRLSALALRIWLNEKVEIHSTFSRHGIAQILSALALLIWLNEKVAFPKTKGYGFISPQNKNASRRGRGSSRSGRLSCPQGWVRAGRILPFCAARVLYNKGGWPPFWAFGSLRAQVWQVFVPVVWLWGQKGFTSSPRMSLTRRLASRLVPMRKCPCLM